MEKQSFKTAILWPSNIIYQNFSQSLNNHDYRYNRYGKYREEGYDGLSPMPRARNTYWSKIPDKIHTEVIDMPLEYPEESSRGVACKMIDEKQYYISESSVYRILKANGLITQAAFNIMAASNEFKDKTTGIHQMWQTDFTYVKITGWGWYYLSTILDDYSRYILHCELCSTMYAKDVTRTIETALIKAGLSKKQRPKLLSDNGLCYISKELKQFVK